VIVIAVVAVVLVQVLIKVKVVNKKVVELIRVNNQNKITQDYKS
jgi:hypothetical protein